MTAIATQPKADAVESLLIQGDLAKLSSEQRSQYYLRVCDSLGLNPLTKPFEYVTLNGKLLLYARKDATEQLRKRDKVSVEIVAREVVEGVYVVTARASTPDGRTDESIGAVTIEGAKGDNRANAMMKAETKAKRRVTLSLCGLGMLDESEVETIPDARVEVTPEPAPQRPEPTPPPKPAHPDREKLRKAIFAEFSRCGRDPAAAWAMSMRWLTTRFPGEPVPYTPETRCVDIEAERLKELLAELRKHPAKGV